MRSKKTSFSKALSLLKDRLHSSRIDESDILEAARELQGIERLEQIKYAILEKDRRITIIQKEKA